MIVNDYVEHCISINVALLYTHSMIQRRYPKKRDKADKKGKTIEKKRFNNVLSFSVSLLSLFLGVRVLFSLFRGSFLSFSDDLFAIDGL